MLRTDYSKCEMIDLITSDEHWQHYESLMLLMMPLGIQRLETDEYINEYWVRLNILQQFSPFLFRGSKITRSQVEHLRGLTTNVSYETRKSWIKRIADGAAASIAYDAQRRDTLEG